ncbi:MAG: archaeosortase/exosortase family protein [Candidatus Competibacterales bacterium]|nr:archaeosortase/exosortase family protein [Candidatus Competibacterales bacterium]
MVTLSRRFSFGLNALLFFAVFLSLYTLYQLSEPLLIHYFNWLAASVAWVAGLLDPAFGARGNLILYAGRPELRVVEGCDGITVFNLIIAAVLAFPKPWRQRLIGVLVLVPILFGINWLRLLILAEIRIYMPEFFGFVHVYLFQPVMIFATFVGFILWILHDASTPKAS